MRHRVVYLDHAAVPSGAELSLVRLIGALDRVDAHVVLAEDGPLHGRLLDVGATVEILPMSAASRTVRRHKVRMGALPITAAAGAATYVARLAARLRHLQPDLVHGNSLRACVYGSVASRLAGLPFVWHVRDRISEDYLPTGAVRGARGLIRYAASGVIANSDATMRTTGLTARTTRPAVRAVIGNVTLPQQRVVLRERVARVGMVGRISPWKGQHVFLEAFAKAFPKGDVRAVIVGAPLFGEDGYLADLHARCRELDIVDRVDFRGHTDEVVAELAHLDVLVHASTLPEPFGQVITEGMAVGLPVIAADAGGAAELVGAGCGLLHTPGDPGSLAAALTRMADDADLRRRVAEAGRARAREFAPEAIAEQVDRFYSLVAGRLHEEGPVTIRHGETTSR